MAFDLSSVLGQATEVVNNAQSGDNELKMKLIYPSVGTLKIKLLYNPKSNLVARQIRRHKVGDTNYTCLSMYNMDCPICKTVESIKNATNQDLWKINQKFRGLSYAQYIGSDGYTWTTDNPQPQVGELIILMYPWTIYQDINRLISTAGPRANEVIASNKGKIVNIVRWSENNQVKYKAELDAFGEFTSFNSDNGEAEFENFLNNLPDLNEEIVPSSCSDKIFKASRDAAETLSREYLHTTGYSGMSSHMSSMPNMSGTAQMIIGADGNKYILVDGKYVPVATSAAANNLQYVQNNESNNSVAIGETPQMSNAQQIQMPHEIIESTPNFMNPPQNPPVDDVPPFDGSTVVGTASVSTADGKQMPECFGKHVDADPKCLSCPQELQCMTMAK